MIQKLIFIFFGFLGTKLLIKKFSITQSILGFKYLLLQLFKKTFLIKLYKVFISKLKVV